ncbi:siderophore-interacting protein [Cellulomonas sp. ATA003]|uniref:siderophore-interacting protein n=1 Tax=Cellulomonas sp. ATA003 TaxID=3073064 RepID=UPI0028736CCD|nr:siderophore-interacting protein [Cellulomonas sp. ATA003]WNB84539.1 siderophore-interacting protein [Cellulomonas sp. ATA003]
MLTFAEAAVVAPVYPAYRPFDAVVQRVLRLSPHFVRVTFTGEDFGLLGRTGLDQRIKLMLPHADGSLCDVGAADPQTILDGSWYARWRDLPADERNPFRTYTVRSVRPERRELDVDMVLHDPAPGQVDGPAAAWLRRAKAGDRVVVVGPDSRTTDPTVGCDWRPGGARHLLLAGDETAAPAIAGIIESLDPGVTAQAFIEVPTGADIQNLVPRGRSQVAWLARDAGCETADGFQAVAPHGALLTQAVATWLPRHMSQLSTVVRPSPDALEDVDVDVDLLWDSPVDPTTGDFYSWIAGEAATVKSLRRHLVSEIGVARSNVAFMGYWRLGRSESQ